MKDEILFFYFERFKLKILLIEFLAIVVIELIFIIILF